MTKVEKSEIRKVFGKVLVPEDIIIEEEDISLGACSCNCNCNCAGD